MSRTPERRRRRVLLCAALAVLSLAWIGPAPLTAPVERTAYLAGSLFPADTNWGEPSDPP